MQLRIYLDLNKYIELSQRFYKKDELSHQLLELVESNKILFPISSAHIIEMNKHSNLTRRQRLAETMWTFSKGLCLINRTDLLNVEIDIAIEDVIKKSVRQNNANQQIFCTNIFRSFIPFEEFNDCIYSPDFSGEENYFRSMEKEFWIKLISVENDIYRRSSIDKIIKENMVIKETINRFRNVVHEEKADSKNYLNDKMLEDVRDRISSRLELQGFNFQYFLSLGAETISIFLHSIPSFDIELQIKLRAFKDLNKKTEENDVFDYGHLTSSIYNYEMLITEKFWAKICNDCKLSEKYNCIITDDLNFLKNLKYYFLDYTR